MSYIHIHGKRYAVNPDHNLLQVCLELGFDLPYFCWHPALGSVGSCRQCAVKQFKDENDTQGRIVMACMTPAQEGTRIAIDEPEAQAFRANVIEWLMLNHPHDCPVCEEGGECHLQDMTLMSGHALRRYRFNKRTHRNQYLGPFIKHEMNRCIACYRCVRFYQDHAGGTDLNVFATHNHVYFGRHADGVLENEFSGNLVEVCPTGVFTDKPFSRHYVRKWDLRQAPSLCVHCAVGCNTSPGERYGRLRRIMNRYHGEINGYFLCDRGRFGHDFVNSARRIRQPLARNGDKLDAATGAQAFTQLHSSLAAGARVIGIGSPRASLESNFALRELVGVDAFVQGVSKNDADSLTLILEILRNGPLRAASLHDVEQADAMLVLGEDVSNTAPRLALSLRQATRNISFAIAAEKGIPGWQDSAVRDAAQQRKSPLYLATPAATRLDDRARRIFHAAPDELARLGHAVAHELDDAAPAPDQPSTELTELAREIAATLRHAERPLVVAGTGCGVGPLQAAANVAHALSNKNHPANIGLAVPECNSLGLALLGGKDLQDTLADIAANGADVLVILENDLYRRAPRELVDKALNSAARVIVIDHIRHDTALRADVVLPAATFAESSGTLVNHEGRAQRYFQVMVAEGEIQPSWLWLRYLMELQGRQPKWQHLDEVIAACAAAVPILRGITRAAPRANYRASGMRIAREPRPYSGRTAMHAERDVHEPKPPPDPDSPLAFSMEGYPGQPPAALIPYFWAPGWSSNEAVNKFQQEIAGPLHGGDAGARLLEPGHSPVRYFDEIPPPFQSQDHAWLLVPLPAVFGGEELSALAPAVAERATAAALLLHPDDLARLEITAGTALTVNIDGVKLKLPARPEPTLPHGVAGLGAGLPTWRDHLPLPAWVEFEIGTDSATSVNREER